MECKNCGNNFEGEFCNHCGQSSRVDKLTLRNFLEEISENIFKVNRGLIFTVKNLFTRPGHSIREFLDGQRKYYVKPIGYVLIISTFYFLVTNISGAVPLLQKTVSGFARGVAEGTQLTGETKIIEVFTHLMSRYFAYSVLLLIPVFSVASFIAFLGKRRNYLEHIVLNSYLTGQQTIFYATFTIIGVLLNQKDLAIGMALFLSVGLRFWTFIQFFKGEKNWRIIGRIFLTYPLMYFMLLIFLGLLASAFLMLEKFYFQSI